MSEIPTLTLMPDPQWYQDALVDVLCEEHVKGGVFLVKGPSSAQVERDFASLRRAFAAQGRLCFAIRPAHGGVDGRGPFFDVLQQYVEEVQGRQKLTAEAQGLFEFLSISYDQSRGDSGEEWSRLSHDAAGRLWSELSRQVPAVLIVLHAHRIIPAERARLQYVLRYFYADPIAALEPELLSWERARGSIVFFDDGLVDEFDPVLLDLRAPALDSVRAFLSNEDIVRRFFNSTGGDLSQLDELVGALPSGIEEFLMHRYERLGAREREIIDVLATASQALSVDALHHVISALGETRHFARSLKDLAAGGFVRRRVGRGTVVIELDNAELGLSVFGAMEEGRRHGIHRALALAELATQGQSASEAFLAHHFLAAGDLEEGMTHGLIAVRHLAQRRSYEPARELLEELLPVATSAEAKQAIHDHLAQVYAQLGDIRQALCHCGHLKPFTHTDAERAQLLERTATLLVRLGECESALRLFEQASTLLQDIGGQEVGLAEIILGRGEALYGLGRYDEAQALGRQALEILDGFGEGRDPVSPRCEQGRLDQGLIRARNLIGKVAIFFVHYEEAIGLFEANNQLAARWGWEKERARAQANIGVVAIQQRRFDEAHQRLSDALELSKIPGSLPRAYCLLNLGNVYQRQGRYDKALDHFLEALRASRQCGDTAAYGICAHNLATLYQDMGTFERALSVVEHLEERAGARRHTFASRWTRLLKGHILLDQERYVEAIEVLEGLRLTDAELHNIVYGAEGLLREVEAHIGLAQWAAASSTLAKFVMPAQGGHEPQLDALRHCIEAALALQEGDLAGAEELARSAARELKDLGNVRDSLRATLILGSVLEQSGRAKEGRALLEAALQSLHERAQSIPAGLRGEFYRIGLHQRLVSKVHALKGEVPGAFELPIAATAAPEDKPLAPRDPAFVKWRARFKGIVGEDPRLHQAFRFVERVASSKTTVLLLGESGTGKELIAEAIHRESNRAHKPFVKVNCAAFVESLLLSELFGHEKGAFTGALSQKAGRFEIANGGTIFLDEIGDISSNTQVALLRVLQEGTFDRVGGSETLKVDVRIVCATNKNLEEMVKRGEFRLDLYYRLKGLVVELPPLRERRRDIPLLLAHFAAHYADGDSPRRFSREALHFLSAYSWAGNVRELENFVKSVLLFVEGPVVEMSHIQEFSEFFADGEVDLDLPELEYVEHVEEPVLVAALEEGKPAPGRSFQSTNEDPEEALIEQIVAEGLSLTRLKKRLELECIKRALLETDGNITRAAELLQMKRPRLSQIINSTPELLNCKESLVG